jgi:hypothetical protein
MKTIKLNYSKFKVYNPVKKDVIIDEECDDKSPSLIAYWHSACFPEPLANNKEIAERWQQYLEDIDDIPDFDYLETFLKEYDNPEWIVYVIEGYGMSCGPVSDTVWLVVDKDTIVIKK